MFVYDFLTFDLPYTTVAAELANDHSAGALTRAVVAAAGAGSNGPADVRFEVGRARSVDGTLVVPIRWTPGDGRSPFQHLEGSLQVEPFGDGGCHLSLSASWDEPATGLGRREDTRHRHREAEMHVRGFLQELVAVLRQDSGNGGLVPNGSGPARQPVGTGTDSP
jgi:hypothetical protein